MQTYSPSAEKLQEALDVYGFDGTKFIFGELLSAVQRASEDLLIEPGIDGLQILVADFKDYSLSGMEFSKRPDYNPVIGSIEHDLETIVQVAIDKNADTVEAGKLIGPVIAHEMFHLHMRSRDIALPIESSARETSLKEFFYAAVIEEGAAIQYETELFSHVLQDPKYTHKNIQISDDEVLLARTKLHLACDSGLDEESGNERFHQFLMLDNCLGYRFARFVVANYLRDHGNASVKVFSSMSVIELAGLLGDPYIEKA